MPSLRRVDVVEIGVPLAVALLAAFALLLPDGSALRLALALPVLIFVPGHLLIAAVTTPPTRLVQRWVRAAMALGVSPAIVGLLALATARLPGGFRAASIVAIITVACVVFAAIALWRRAIARTPVDDAQQASSEAADGEALAT